MKNLMIIFNLLFSFSLFAKDFTFELKSTEDSIRDKILPFVQPFDKETSLIVTAEPEIDSVKLTLTPFVIKDLITTPSGRIKLKNLKIEIYNLSGSLPDSVQEIVKKIGSDYSPEISLIVLKRETLPTISLSEQGFGVIVREYLIEFMVFTFMLLAGIGFLWAQLSKSKLTKGIQKGLVDGLTKVSESFEKGNKTSQKQQTEQSSNNNKITIESNSDFFWQNLGSDSYKAMLSDCYWCEKDRYASFIWKRAPGNIKTECIAALPFLRDYSRYVIRLEEEDLKFEQDPYYLNPKPIYFINNADLTKVVRDNPGLFHQLSRMRGDSLDLTVLERLDYLEKALDQEVELAEISSLESFTPSPIRKIKMFQRMNLKSIEEEQEILKRKDLSLEIIELIPSLGWFLHHPNKDIEKILSKYSARDLSTAWLAPKEVLKKLESCLPQAKKDLLLNYLDAIEPSRSAPIFEQLFQDCMHLFEQMHNKSEKVLEDKAA